MKLKHFYQNKNILITGGLGFIGSNLAIRLVNLGANVTIIDSLDKHCGGNEFNIESVKGQVRLIKKDIRNLKLMESLVNGQEIIFNLAGHLSHKRSMEQPKLDLDLNVASSLSLLEACKKNNAKIKIVYTGTRGQYGKIIHNPVNEEHPTNFKDVNGISKHTAENFHFLYDYLYPNIKVTSVRLTNCYGPRHQMLDSSQGFMGWFIRKAIDNETIEIWSGEQTRDINFVDDVVDALLLLGMKEEAEGEVFNLGSGKEISLKEVAQLIVGICKSGNIKVIPMSEFYKKIELGRYKADIRKIKERIGWEPKKDIKEGLKETIDFYKKYKERYW